MKLNNDVIIVIQYGDRTNWIIIYQRLIVIIRGSRLERDTNQQHPARHNGVIDKLPTPAYG